MAKKFQTVYDRPYSGAITEYSFAERDPYWQVGYLLAQNYNANYNKRGIDKATASAEEELARSRAAMNGEYAGANKTLDNIESNYLNSNFPAYKPMQGMPQGTGQQIGNMLGQFPAYKSEYAMPNNTGTNIANIAQNAPQGYESAKGLPTNAGSRINAVQGVYGAYEPIQRTAADNAMQEYAKAQGIIPEPKAVPQDFDAAQFKAEFYKQQRALGRPDYQIEAALETLAPQINQMTIDNNLKKSGNIIEQLAALAPKADDLTPNVNNAERMKLISELRKYDPEMATLYAKDLIGNRDAWANKSAALKAYEASNARTQARIDQVEALGRQAGLQGDELKKFVLYGGMKGNTSNNTSARTNRSYAANNSGGRGRSIIGSKEFEFANGRVNEIEEKMRDREELTPQERKDYDRYKPYVDNVISSVYGEGAKPQPAKSSAGLSNWNNVEAMIQDALKQGVSKADILKNAKTLADNGNMPAEFYTAIENSFKPEKVPSPAAKKNDEPLFKDGFLPSLNIGFSLDSIGDILSGRKPLFDIAHK